MWKSKPELKLRETRAAFITNVQTSTRSVCFDIKGYFSVQTTTLLQERKMVIMYHYTNKQGLDAIKKRGYISESNDTAKDAAYGYGVYLTHLSQDVDKITVAKNCWDKGHESAIKQGKLDYVIRIEIPIQELYCFKDGKRIVYLYSGQLVLRHYRHEFFKCNWGNDNNDGIVIGLVTGLIGTTAVLGVAVVKAIL